MDAIRAITPTRPEHIPDKLRSLASFWREIASERSRDSMMGEHPDDRAAWAHEADQWERAANALETAANSLEQEELPL